VAAGVVSQAPGVLSSLLVQHRRGRSDTSVASPALGGALPSHLDVLGRVSSIVAVHIVVVLLCLFISPSCVVVSGCRVGFPRHFSSSQFRPVNEAVGGVGHHHRACRAEAVVSGVKSFGVRRFLQAGGRLLAAASVLAAGWSALVWLAARRKFGMGGCHGLLGRAVPVVAGLLRLAS
jgi:hypothetical protein